MIDISQYKPMKTSTLMRAAALAALILAAGCAGKTNKYPLEPGKNLSVIFFDVGQGDSALIITPDLMKILVDCGEFDDAATYIKEMNITWIDILLITHPDRDHSGGCKAVMDFAEVGNLLTNENVKSDFMIELTNTTFIKAITAYDTAGRFKSENDNSVALKIGYGNISMLFMGDCESMCEKELLKTHKNELGADLLKAGHHGAKYSTTKEFLEEAMPSAAIISAGKNNKYGHPSNDTLERLKKAGTTIYRTDIEGTIIITTDGNEYSAR